MKQELKFEDAMVFAREYEGRTSYSIGVSSKKYVGGQKTDEWVNSYLIAQFPRDNAPSDREKIDITKSFLAAYSGRDGRNGIKLVVTDWNPSDDGYDDFGV